MLVVDGSRHETVLGTANITRFTAPASIPSRNSFIESTSSLPRNTSAPGSVYTLGAAAITETSQEIVPSVRFRVRLNHVESATRF